MIRVFDQVSFCLNEKYLDAEQNYDYYQSFFEAQKRHLITNAGRGGAYIFSCIGRKFIHRDYCRGGLVGKFIKDKFFVHSKTAHRSFDEFRLLQKLKSLGLKVPDVLIAREEKQGHFIRQEIVVFYLEGAINLDELMQNRALSEEELLSLKLEIEKMFKLGLMHSDFNLKNILLVYDSIYFIDFDKCSLKESLNQADKKSMIKRLKRSIDKQQHIAQASNKSFYGVDDIKNMLDSINM